MGYYKWHICIADFSRKKVLIALVNYHILYHFHRITSPYSPTFGHAHQSHDDVIADQMIEKAIAAISPEMMNFHSLLLRKPQVVQV